ncbi:circadian clock protein KaiC [Hyalangium rubrum]|uniref:non-specific serine/threonine protein kinase n=1 Tax=Hyalangium rubrum TaxID=3103134 RepID=A0ABU5GZT6_9BACT|nr:circadian clock protein KaiC [Hyalangium sp. s54d21]MDY7226214.1 circadian clock protein KaiC [Hyalangium sp. s54d21]
MSPVVKVATGISGLDRITQGGLPKGRTTLITGKSGAAKSVLALQLAGHFARSGMKTVVFAVEETPSDLIESGDSLGFGLSELVAQGQLRFADLTHPADSATVVTGDYDITAMLHRVEAAAKEFGAQALILDSATALFSPKPSEERLRSHFFHLIDSFRKYQLTAVVTAEAPDDYGPRTTLGVEDFVCDVVLVLRNLIDSERRRRTIEVHKYRRSGHQKGEYPCTVSARGLMVFPFGAPASQERLQNERFSSGFEGLDSMMNGGWLRDSITMLRGPAGSGKTTMAGMYARAGAQRGERVAYYGFEETKPMLMRNFSNIGMPMEEFTQAGTLLLECRYPEATSPEDLLVELRQSLEEFRPSLIVLDSISSVAHSTSTRGFRQFMVGFASLVREHNRSALLTQTINDVKEDERTAPFLSTIADAIISLDYHRHGKKLERTINVTKMRGSAHSDDAFRLMIRPGGLGVSELE